MTAAKSELLGTMPTSGQMETISKVGTVSRALIRLCTTVIVHSRRFPTRMKFWLV